MPGIVVPVHNLREEEKRNLILRLRFGSQLHQTKNEPDGSLCIEGQAVVHQPRCRNVTNYIPFGADRVRHLLGRPLKIVNYPISETQQRKGIMDTTLQTLKRRELEGTRIYDENAHNANNEIMEPQHQNHADGASLVQTLSKQRNNTDCEGNHASQTMVGDVGYYESGDSGERDAVADGKVTCPNKAHPSGQSVKSLNRAMWPSGKGVCGDGGQRRFRKGDEAGDNKGSAGDERKMAGKLWPTSDEENAANEKQNSSPRPRKASRALQSRQSTSSRIPSEDSRNQLRKSSSKPTLAKKRSSKILESSKGMHNKDSNKSSDSRFTPSRDELEDLEVTSVRKFNEMPKSKPKNICFDYPGVDLTYLDVKKAIERVIPDAFEKNKVVSMQFENVNVKLKTGNRDNRWHIELADFITRNKLVKSGLTIKHMRKRTKTEVPVAQSGTEEPRKAPTVVTIEKHHVAVKLYDVVMIEEYKLFLRKNAAEEKLQNVVLMCAGRGHRLSTML